MKKQKSPLKKWFDDNRWNLQAVADAIGVSRMTVHNHVYGFSQMQAKTITAYKEFGVPRDVLRAHFSWFVDNA
jgi:predicted DNA-binding protein YlxM (UPF0122 family)